MSPNHEGPGGRIGRVIGGVVDLAVGTVGRGLLSVLHLPGMGHRRDTDHTVPPGTAPGIESFPGAAVPLDETNVGVRCIDYGPDRVETVTVEDLDAFLAAPQPAWATVRWINVDGLHPSIVGRFQKAFDFHALAAEDVLTVPQRPKAEPYEKHLFVATRMFRLLGEQLVAEQVSFFVSKGLVITFQQSPGDVWQPIRDRIAKKGSRIRKGDASHLAYALIDAIVDHSFPILERYGDLLEQLEKKVLDGTTHELLEEIHAIKGDLTVLRRVLWPMRELVDALLRSDFPAIAARTKTYLRDVHDHAVQLLDIVETLREQANSLTDLHLSVLSTRLNETMKVLTIMASLFIPITFLAGVYGMNFTHFPELDVRWAYPAFWGICGATTVGLLWFFRRKGWIGRG